MKSLGKILREADICFEIYSQFPPSGFRGTRTPLPCGAGVQAGDVERHKLSNKIILICLLLTPF